jgi:hypothetical protein
MTAITSGAGRLPARLAATRAGLHQVAEHILAAALHAETGEIALMPSPGGFRTPPFGRDHRFLAVDGTELVAGGTESSRRTALTTLRAAAEFAGITPGAPAEVYRPATPLDLDEPLTIDPAAARVLADWYQLGEQALRGFTAEIPGKARVSSSARFVTRHTCTGCSTGFTTSGSIWWPWSHRRTVHARRRHDRRDGRPGIRSRAWLSNGAVLARGAGGADGYPGSAGRIR